ncbi:enoyl-CoA hydratase-related protein [Amycolatopsis rhabdoformis]|uniref:Enoyl-CoA hydratase-related protein n=1 Tax=Amycolatopsis rhabdoformis TaxID=1448059 RepID=A0ABZ1IGW9_9PSEU|nr:enoyl-CoA hydratase-related protein [Amycolatopsis rhabdoformis]WSE33373.1 enoyl-CoA hydratase-related protein [Amycolatopsis rhabdoformis]
MIDLEHDHGVAVVRIHENPDFEMHCGTMVPETLDRITAALAYIGGSHAVVLTGGDDVFARGFAGGGAADRLERAVLAIAHHPSPVVAALGGDALGAGYALAAAADLRVMSAGRLGLGAGAQVAPAVEAVLQRHAGPVWRTVRSGERTFTPEAALVAGLVETCCAPADLLTVAVARAARLAGGAKQFC